ncbi:HU family DNA-binding protein [uncultured Amphritea sp.]|uniref:HU family DNA-binding protein n=1 Tax=uncultured Amphritea sp. TaxID=981605 RepID=UPI00261C4ADC|nr:HU family DNA-binding protein [uncultured Amphritea sp.]
MNKAELIEAVTQRMKIHHSRAVSKTDVDNLLESLGHVTTNEIKSGGEVTLPALGKLTVGVRAARTGRNPQTGAAIEIPAAKVAKFKALKSLKDALN